MGKENKSPLLTQTSIRFPPDLKKRVDLALVERGTTLQAAIHEALESWLAREAERISDKIHNSGEAPPSVSPKLGVIFSQPRAASGENAELHDKLDRILAGGVAVEAITHNLNAFDELTELKHGKGSPDPGKPAPSLDEGIAQAEREAEEIRRSVPEADHTKRAVPARKRNPRAAGGRGNR